MEQLINTTLSSDVDGIHFPPLPGASSVTKLATLFQLEQSQWWSVEALLKLQLRQTQALLKHAIKNTAYYNHARYKKINLSNLSYDDWLTLPLLTRDEIQQAGSNLCSQSVPTSHGKTMKQVTSGSTGKPIETIATEINSFFWDVFTLRDHFWHQRDLSKSLAVIRFNEDPQAKYPNYIHAKNWGKATNNIYKTGDCFVLSIFTPVEQQIEWLKKVKPHYLLTHPSVLKELALYCIDNTITLPFLKEVRTISEAIPDNLRALCQEAWNVSLVDTYSSVELGYLALQCPEHEHYHVQSEGALIEILDDNGMPCKPNEVGRIVVTALHNFAFPLIRYEIGDYAEAGGPCSCGRGLPVIKRILGRYRNLITLPDGSKVWPKFSLSKMVGCAPVKQFQAVQHEIDHVEYFLICERTLTTTETNCLRELFQNNLHPDILISITEVDKLQRSKNGKYEEFISHI